MPPVGFEDEATLHRLIEEAPQLLPLSGSPRLTVVGSEVQVGNGYADLVAVELGGRIVVIEIKLARSSEARRAVVAQVLTYAAYLRGLDPERLEQEVLAPHLRARGASTLEELLGGTDQEGAFDAATFQRGLRDSLQDGAFRIVVALDSAPDELVQLMGYLESLTDKIVIDLVTISAYDVGGSRVLVPQRVDAERPSVATRLSTPQPAKQAILVPGSEDFEASIGEAPAEHREMLRRLLEWARQLEREGLVTLSTAHGTTGRKTLLPRLKDVQAGLVTVWNDRGAYLSGYRTLFEKRAPKGLEEVDRIIAPGRVGQGNWLKPITEELLDALTRSYREATNPARMAST